MVHKLSNSIDIKILLVYNKNQRGGEGEMDYKEMYFKLYSDIAKFIEQLKEIMNEYEDEYCNVSVREDNE